MLYLYFVLMCEGWIIQAVHRQAEQISQLMEGSLKRRVCDASFSTLSQRPGS